MVRFATRGLAAVRSCIALPLRALPLRLPRAALLLALVVSTTIVVYASLRLLSPTPYALLPPAKDPATPPPDAVGDLPLDSPAVPQSKTSWWFRFFFPNSIHPYKPKARNASVTPKRESYLSEDSFQSDLWKWYAQTIPDYDPKALGIVPESRGIVFTSPPRWIGNMLQSAAVLRQLGCQLPIQLSYIEGELSEAELQSVRAFNISTVDISQEIKKYTWGESEKGLGGPKVDAILSSPFEEVMFLDPDVMPLRDPTYLFETSRFKKYGALVWGDTMARGKGSRLWKVMGLKGKYRPEMEFESGQMVFNKKKVWKGLMMAKHLASQAKYYFKHFWGDKETFHWGFRAVDIPYFINPAYLQVVGVIADKSHLAGGVELQLNADGTYAVPPGAKYCGLAMLQLDFYDGDENDREAILNYQAKPLFMHGNGLKYSFHAEITSFYAAMTYVPPPGKFVYEFSGMFHDWIGNYGQLEHCIGLVPVNGLSIKIWDWESQNPGYSDMYREAHKIGFAQTIEQRQKILDKKTTDAVQKKKWVDFMQHLEPYDAKRLGIIPGSRGVVLTGGNKWVNNVVMASLFLKDLGCDLPVAFTYLKDQVSPDNLEKLSSYNITLIDITDTIKQYDWSTSEMSLGGVKADTILAAPYEQVLFLDPDVMPVQNPLKFFESKTFKRNGALFWPDFMKRDRYSDLWKVMNLQDQYAPSQEIESGQIFVDKRLAWKGLKLAQHMAAEAKYYFQHFWGDKETFFWAFKASGTSFFLNPHYIHLVGQIANSDHPMGDISLIENADGSSAIPAGAGFCGLNMVQHDFKDGDVDDSTAVDQSFDPKPAFMHWNGLKYAYHKGIEPFAVARTYIPPKGKQIHDFEGVFYGWMGNFHQLRHCIDLPERSDLTLRTWNFTNVMPDLGAKFHKAHHEAYSNAWKLKGSGRLETDAADDDDDVASSLDDLDRTQRSKWKRYLRDLKEYDPKAAGVTPGSRGVVITGPGNRADYVILTAELLRETGCTLPIQFSYLKDQVSTEDLERVKAHNISVRDFSDSIKDYDWSEREMSLGGPKVDSILASPFEQVLFLDPDIHVLKNPEYLFETAMFKKLGALFWPDTYRRSADNKMWDLFDLQGKYINEHEFESGEMVLDKKKVWKALMLAKHMSAEAKYYFEHFWGDKETFHWAFKATNTPYFMNSNYLSVVGLIADKEHPKGGIPLETGADGQPSIPDGARFCGLSMLQMSFEDKPDEPRVPPSTAAERGFAPQPLFMHGNGVKYAYSDDVPAYHVARTYVPGKGRYVHDYDGIFHEWIGGYEQLEHCIDFSPRPDIELQTWDWMKEHPGVSEQYRDARRKLGM